MKQFNIFRGLAIALMLICCNAVWAYDIEVNGIYYNISSTTDLTVEVTEGDNKYSGEVIIPVTVSYKSKTLTVTSIGERAFKNCDSLTSVIIGNSVTSIGDGAFCDCTGLTSIAIPNSVTSIGESAFCRCTSLKNLQIEDGETTLWLEPNNYFTGGGKGLFYYCPLETIYLGRNLLYDVTYAHGFSPFYGIKSLKSVTISYCVTSIKNNVFSYCTGLTSIVVEEGNKKYDSRNNCNAIIETNTNTLVAGCKNTIIPNSVTSIGNYAFSGCTGLTSIIIPNSVTSIGNYAFRDCSSLTSIKIPNGIKTIWSETFYGCKGLTSVTIPNSVTSIGDWAFRDCGGLTSVTIPNSVTSIGRSAFEGCDGLTSVTIGNGVTSIGDYAFYGCSGIKIIYLLGELPPTVKNNNFTKSQYIDITVYVPIGSLKTYQNAEVWKEFWEIKEYSVNNKVTYIVDGETYATDSIAFGDSIVLIDAPTKKGYTFSGWSGVPSTMPPHDITIEGTFSVNTYTVTYVVDGDVYARDSVAYGSEVVLRDEPAKEGHTFSGWSEAPETMPAEDIIIEGTFSVNSYILIFLLDGEVYETKTVEYGTEIELPTVSEREGYEFTGWMNVPVTMPAHNVTIKGSFTVNYYTVTYIVDGETYVTDSVAYGSEVVLRDEPVKEGHTFSGWSEAPETMPAEDIIIEGTFSVNSYILTFMIDGEVYETATIEYGTEIKLPTVPEKEGYKFSGWMNVPATMPANDIIVEGHYIADTAIGQVYIDLEKNEVYNLKGLRVTETNKLARGIYIINGKKVLLK